MMRFRRYRVFVAVALVTLIVLYHFSSAQNWESAKDASLEKLKNLGLKPTVAAPTPTPIATPLTGSNSKTESSKGSDWKLSSEKSDLKNNDPKNGDAKKGGTTNSDSKTSDSKASGSKASDSKISDSKTADVLKSDAKKSDSKAPAGDLGADKSKSDSDRPKVIPRPFSDDVGEFRLTGQGRHEVAPEMPGKAPIRWQRLPEHFPIPESMVIPLPKQKSVAIPKIQYLFSDESLAAKEDREIKLAEIKEAFTHSWAGYKKHAWMHDELSPVSGRFRDPFCSWAATLVDSLDTLWIMGMEKDFAEAVKAVGKIDFTTSPRKDIPIFETTIRYLGGLLAAYDVSGGKYKTLLDKAVELADVLMGAFDTPNRMPIGYYYWRPTFAKNPHRASPRAVMAEVGSLSVEFTRLAQLTKNNRYYDAIARITDELEEYQSRSTVPGLWPTLVDTSGCRKPERPLYDSFEEVDVQTPLQKELGSSSHEGFIGSSLPSKATGPLVAEPLAENAPAAAGNRMKADEPPEGFDTRPSQERAKDDSEKRKVKQKRQLDDIELAPPTPETSDHLIGHNPTPGKVDCEPQGIDAPPNAELQIYSLGGQADSTFEYLPKMFMLLGGVVPKYRSMYEKVISAVNEHMLFRPMVPDNRDLRAVGSLRVKQEGKQKPNIVLKPEITHLTCFVGGMWGIGGKIFDRPEDVEVAKKLTDACVWAYNQTDTGIMPETAELIACPDMKDCKWDKKKWYEMLDPWREYREAGERIHKEAQKFAEKQNSKAAAAAVLEAATAKEKEVELQGDEKSASKPGPKLGSKADGLSGPVSQPGKTARSEDIAKTSMEKREIPADDASSIPSPEDIGLLSSTLPTENAYPTHEEYVEGRIASERIPEGIPSIDQRQYILRPEAIESVFIMYRITGDESWREKGYRMFQAIQKHCRAEFGYSAIGDVTDAESYQLDEMESFWLAETLKYFYLLFSPPSKISLDEYVLNTEAHPMKRPR